MYKKIILITCIFLLTITGCSVIEDFDKIGLQEKHYKQMIEDVFHALDNNDNESLKKLFATSVINSNENLDMQIQELIEFYDGKVESFEGENNSATSSRLGGDTYIEKTGGFTVVVDGINYEVNLYMVVYDEQNPDNEGLHMLEFATEDAYNSKYFAWHFIEDNVHGAYVQTSTDKREDVLMVENRCFYYKSFDRNLDDYDFLDYIRHNLSYSGLINTVGEPNSDWSNYGYYYFVLENKNILVCNINVFSDEIKYMYVANEDEELYLVWHADDIIKVHGSYQDYLKIDRELSEETFLSFVENSRDLKELHKEIGEPSVDTSFYTYYKLEDNTFIGCYHAGYIVKEIFVSDSEKKLYTIWKYEE